MRCLTTVVFAMMVLVISIVISGCASESGIPSDSGGPRYVSCNGNTVCDEAERYSNSCTKAKLLRPNCECTGFWACFANCINEANCEEINDSTFRYHPPTDKS